MRASLIPLLCVLSLPACAGSPSPSPESPSDRPAESASAASASPAPDAPAKPSSSPSTAASAEAAPPPPEATAKADAPPKTSTWQIDGVSVSDVTAAQLQAALKKRGWSGQAIGETKHGKYEMFGFIVKKGGDAVNVSIARVAKTPGPADASTNEAAFSPEALEKLYSSNDGITQARDPEAQVLAVALAMGKRSNPKAAAKLFDDLVQRPK